MNTQVRTPLLLMAGIEWVIAFSSIYFAGAIVFGSLVNCEEALGSLAPRAAVIAVVMVASLVAMGLYQFNQRINFHESAIRVLAGLVAGCTVLAAIFYAFPQITISSDLAKIAVGYALVLLLFVRFFFVRTVDENVFRHRTLIYGAGKRAARISHLRRRADRRGFRIVGRVSAPGDKMVGDTDVFPTNGDDITDIAILKNADEIVVAMDDRRGNLPIRDLLNAKLRGIEVLDLLEFLERETGKIWIDLVNPGWLIFSPGFRTTKLRRIIKRVMDLLISGIMSLMAVPVLLLIIVAIKLEDGILAPVLYRQRRVGRGGKSFSVMKFRSMSIDAEADGKAIWADKNDCRVTKVGGFLRSVRLDELPQLWNVMRGQMSIVGPRPERPEFVSGLEETIPYYSKRHTVKPGLTGWAQLNYSYGASEEDAAEKLKYDLYYIKNQTLMLDILIILQTVEVVLWGKGAR